ncbi:MAG: cytochrome c [Pseudolabrys sp.]|jgi:mono/diheme cytochrome c family protein
MVSKLSATQAFIAAVAFVMYVATAQAAQVGSAERGLRIVREQCAECHLLGKEKGLSTNLQASTFAKIANTPGMTAAALRVALSTSHRSMPNIIIKSDDADSIIAYILSLRDIR